MSPLKENERHSKERKRKLAKMSYAMFRNNETQNIQQGRKLPKQIKISNENFSSKEKKGSLRKKIIILIEAQNE